MPNYLFDMVVELYTIQGVGAIMPTDSKGAIRPRYRKQKKVSKNPVTQ